MNELLWQSISSFVQRGPSSLALSAVSPAARTAIEGERVETMSTMRIRRWWLQTLPSINVEVSGSDLEDALDVLEWCCISRLNLRDVTDEHLRILADKHVEEVAYNHALDQQDALENGDVDTLRG
jgi:hypothetical protein